jgi:hypothetical protein
VRWNEGYYFTTCRRCMMDLIRTAYGTWQIPRGFRIVWSVGRPDSVESARIESEVEQQLSAFAEPPPPPAPAPPPTFVPDFMEDATIDTSWRRHIPAANLEEKQESEIAATPTRRKREAAQPVSRVAETPGAAAGARWPLRNMALALAAFVLIAIVTAVFAQDEEAGAARPSSPPLGSTWFVGNDSSCRETPSLEGANVGYLIRGDAVRLRARKGNWAAIAYADQECWVPLTLLSVEPVT